MINALSLNTSAVAASITSCGGLQPIFCAHCGTPVAELVGGMLVIRARHHGENHVTVLNLVSLAQGLKLL
jgi:hypothetical protein